MDGFFLISSAFVSTATELHNPSPSTFETPASFKARREALELSTAQLGSLLGISAANVSVIESLSLGDEVVFLHNLTLSLLELGGLEALDC
ncbi:MAG: helix-turn-helix transcriptional regulator [Acidobacteriota bacterium]